MEVHSLCVFTKRKLRKNEKISEWDVLCDMFTESTSTVNIRIWWSFRLLPCENVLFSVYQSNVTNITMKTINFQHPINIASLGVRHQAIDTKRNHCYRKKFSSATVQCAFHTDKVFCLNGLGIFTLIIFVNSIIGENLMTKLHPFRIRSVDFESVNRFQYKCFDANATIALGCLSFWVNDFASTLSKWKEYGMTWHGLVSFQWPKKLT